MARLIEARFSSRPPSTGVCQKMKRQLNGTAIDCSNLSWLIRNWPECEQSMASWIALRLWMSLISACVDIVLFLFSGSTHVLTPTIFLDGLKSLDLPSPKSEWKILETLFLLVKLLDPGPRCSLMTLCRWDWGPIKSLGDLPSCFFLHFLRIICPPFSTFRATGTNELPDNTTYRSTDIPLLHVPFCLMCDHLDTPRSCHITIQPIYSKTSTRITP